MAEAGCLLSLDEAAARIDAAIAPLPDEGVALASSLGRRLARDVIADHHVPRADRAACDGFAVRAEETFGAGPYAPTALRLSPAGAAVGPGWAAPCLEGDPLPEGADAVVPLDEAEIVGGRIDLADALAPGDHVLRAGAHATAGTVLLERGRRLDPDHIGLLTAAGCARVNVFRKPRVSILSTRHEGRAAGSESDRALLEALVARDGGLLVNGLAIVRDADAVARALSDSEADLCIVTSGSRVRPEDAAVAALATTGGMTFYGVALAPGTATGLGRTARGLPVFIVPAAPEQCLWAYEFLAGRGGRRLEGGDGAPPFETRRVRTAAKIVSAIGMTEIHPVRLEPDGSARPLPRGADGGLASAARADAFAILPEGSEGVGTGSGIDVHLRQGASARPQVNETRSRR